MSTEASGICKHCGQSKIITDEDRKVYPNVKDTEELASLTCVCEDGRKYREAKRQEVVNMQFISFVKNDLLEFMRENDLKRMSVVDDNGNYAVLLRLEKGDTKITTSLKEVVG